MNSQSRSRPWDRSFLGRLGRVLAVVLFVFTGFAQGADSSYSLSVVTVDTASTVVKSFFGLGIQCDPYEYRPSAEAWALTRRRLDFARPAFFRVMTGGKSYCSGFDTAGKPRYVWSEGEAAVRARLGSLLDILDYAQSNHIDVLLGEWSWPGWLGKTKAEAVTRAKDPRWAALAANFVQWLRTERGYTVVRYFNLMNEPNGSWMWPDKKPDYAAWSAGIRNLRRELDERGLGAVAIVGPDNSWGWDWAERASQGLPGEIGAWEMHWYAKDAEVLGGEIQRRLSATRAIILANDPQAGRKRFFLAESGLLDGKCNGDQQPRVKTFPYGVLMADYAAQVTGAGWMGLCAWDLDDAMHKATPTRPVVPGPLTLKVWGFWNTQGTAMGQPEEENIRPWFYPWSLMARLFPRDTRMVAVRAEGTANLRVMAGAAGDGINVMVVNEAAARRSVRVVVPGAGRRTMRMYRYFEADRPADQDGFAVPAATLTGADLESGVDVVMPGRGCVFLDSE